MTSPAPVLPRATVVICVYTEKRWDDIVAAVKTNGVPVEYVIFQDEGHGFTKKKNQIEGYSAVLKFLDTHLKGKASGTR